MRASIKRPAGVTRLPVLGLLLLASVVAFAADVVVDPYHDYRDEVERGEFSYDDSNDIPWIENETEVLAVPDPADLSPVRLDALPDGLELLIDKRRITVGEQDDVVRAWLWVRSSAGNESGTFEGFRCETGEYKVYAYANPRRQPPVSKAKRPRWVEMKGPGYGNYRLELLRDYLCGIRGVRSPEEIRSYLTGEFHRETFMSH